MSNLEGAAKPLLIPPITRAPVSYGRRAQAILAAWGAKTCLVLHATQGSERIAPPALYAYLRTHRKPPPQVSVWMGSHYRAKEDSVNSVFIQRPLFLQPLNEKHAPTPRFGFLCFLAVGGVSFVVVGHRYRNRTEITYEGAFDEALIQIWPKPPSSITYPPKYMMDREFIDVLTESPSALTVQVLPSAE